VFADGYGSDRLRDGPCQAAGHLDSECSVLTTPDPSTHAFPNTGGRICTSGSTQIESLQFLAPTYTDFSETFDYVKMLLR
jgi:hypothetical protein